MTPGSLPGACCTSTGWRSGHCRDRSHRGPDDILPRWSCLSCCSSFRKSCLPRVVRSVTGAIHHDGKPVAHRILDEILLGNCCVLLQPVFQCEPFEGSSEFVIDLGPCSPKFGCRQWIGEHAVRIQDIRLVQLSVKSLPNAK